MKLFHSELTQSYATYSFGYCNYALKESHDAYSEIYDFGYLPYSGTKDLANIYYMARSVRINIAEWTPNSENRRVYNKFEEDLTARVIALNNFNQTANFKSFCLDYFAQRHDPKIMPADRLDLILQSVTHIVEYQLNGAIVAYVFLVSDESMDHFWYSFYDLHYTNQSLGLWLMIDCALRAQQSGKKHLYLGTAHGEKGVYKTNFDFIEYWTGERWSQDIRVLKERCRSDADRTIGQKDEWKTSNDHILF